MLGQAAMIGQSGCLSWWCRWAHRADSGVFSLETVFQRAPGIFFDRLSGVIAAGQGHLAVLYCHLIEAWLPCASHTRQPITALSATHPIPFSAGVKSSAATDEQSSFSPRQRAASSPLVLCCRLGWLLSYPLAWLFSTPLELQYPVDCRRRCSRLSSPWIERGYNY